LVSIELQTPDGVRTALGPGAAETNVRLPDSSPPYEEGLREKTVVHRLAAGPIEVLCKTCQPEAKTLVRMSGFLTLGRDFQASQFDFTGKEMRIHFTDVRASKSGSRTAYSADVVTPWSNVNEVKRVLTPDRSFGFKLLLSAAVAAVLGGLALGDGIGDHHDASTVFAAVALPVAGLLGIDGAWYTLAPPRNEVLFRGTTGAAR
jgi:hypothetical protein